MEGEGNARERRNIVGQSDFSSLYIFTKEQLSIKLFLPDEIN